MYWWDIASRTVGSGTTRRLGFITTNSITQVFNRSVIEHTPAELAFAIPDHPWVDGTDGADVRIAMTVAARSPANRTIAVVRSETLVPEGYGASVVELTLDHPERINSDLSGGIDLAKAAQLKANADLAVQGMNPLGLGFRLNANDLERLAISPTNLPPHLHKYLIGRDLVGRHEAKWVIDFYGLTEREAETASPRLFQHLLDNVKPERDQNRRKTRRENWWLFGENAPTLRNGLRGLERAIATCRTAKHRVFTFVPSTTVLDAKIIGIALDNSYHLGVLSSKIHRVWALRTGGWLGVGNDSNYNHSDCFGKFPFPSDVPAALVERLQSEADALDVLRKRVLAEHPDLTLTKLYNVLDALRESRPLTDTEREIHDRGLVALIRRHHDAIDAAVAEAYGWPVDLPQGEILTRLVALNRERAAEEAHSLIRYLRPEFQDPGCRAPINETLDLGEAVAAMPDNIIAWPKDLPAQIGAVQSILSNSREPLAVQDIARAFKGKRAATVRPVLDALAGVGLARRAGEGKYAA